ncbi:MAG: hypothetical protein LBJ08_03730 [Bifidobacteriaceae bacterium]|jgi:hypothetical protein|nr:hypothetical protein [Bifidobacteriaceae bacterium]
MRIVHVSPSALAGAPGMLAAAQNAFAGHDALHLRCGDYGPSRDAMSANSIPLTACRADRDTFEAAARQADVLHIHTGLPEFASEWLAETGAARIRPCIYHVHSFVGEPPIYGDLSGDLGIAWAAKVAVAQAHPRMYPGFRMMPNCLYRPGVNSGARPWEHPGRPVTVLFSPSTAAGGRWGRKSSAGFARALRRLTREPGIAVMTVRGWAPERLLALRTTVEFGLDEVVTGGFHLVSLETMAAGGIAVNAADGEAIACLQIGARAPAPPPFLHATPATLVEAIRSAARDPGRLARWRRDSHAYFWRWLAPGRIVGLWDELYREAMG